MAKLGDICTLVNGYAFKPSDWSEEGVPIIRIQNLNDESAPFNYYSGKIDSKYNVSDGDLLFAWSGTPGTSFGAFFWNRGTGILNQHIFNVHPIESIDKPYFRYALNGKLDIIISKAHGGVGLQHITKKELENIDISVPPLSTQKQISATLDKATQTIDLCNAILEKLDLLVKAKFVELFGDINVNDKNWDVYPLGELCTIVRGGSPRPIERYLGGDVPWIKIGDATEENSIYLNSTKEHIIHEGVKKSRLIKAGSLIFANCGVSLGFARIITFDGCIHDGWLAMEDIDDRLNKIFLLQALNQMTDHFRKIAPSGTQPNLNTAIMKAYKQVIPPLELQQQYIDFAAQTDRTKSAVKQVLAKAETLKKALMQEYFG